MYDREEMRDPVPEDAQVDTEHICFSRHPISIQPLAKGFVLEIGCEKYSMAFRNKKALLRALNIYLDNPRGARKLFEAGELDYMWEDEEDQS